MVIQAEELYQTEFFRVFNSEATCFGAIIPNKGEWLRYLDFIEKQWEVSCDRSLEASPDDYPVAVFTEQNGQNAPYMRFEEPSVRDVTEPYFTVRRPLRMRGISLGKRVRVTEPEQTFTVRSAALGYGVNITAEKDSDGNVILWFRTAPLLSE